MDLNTKVVAHIKIIRKQKGLSQEKLSELSGLDPKYINKLENVRFCISLATLGKIDGLNIDNIDFFNTMRINNLSTTQKLVNPSNQLDLIKKEIVIEKLLDLLEEFTDK